MNTTDFNDIVNTQIEHSTSVLIKKAGEYASDTDRLANFKTAAVLQGITPAQALGGMMAKHTQSVYAMIQTGELYTEEMWDEKIGDHINYLLLLRAQVAEDGFKVPHIENPEPLASWERALLKGEEPFPEEQDPKPTDKEVLDDIAQLLSEAQDWGADQMQDIVLHVQSVRKVEMEQLVAPGMRSDGIKTSSLIFGSEDVAHEVLDTLNKLIEQYEVATLADLHDLAGEGSTYKDNQVGWRNLSVVTVDKVGTGGYYLHLPPAKDLDQLRFRDPLDISQGGQVSPADQPVLMDVYSRFPTDYNKAYTSDVDIVPVLREDYNKHIEDQTALNDIARVLSTADTVDEEEQSIFDIVQKVRVVEVDES